MKKILLLILSGVLLFYSCGNKSNKEKVPSEPNNKIEEANIVETEQEVKMKINPQKDIDWYKLEIPGNGYLKVVSKSVPDVIDLQVRFATYEEWEGEKTNYLTGFLKTPAAVQLSGVDTCYVMVADRWNENSSENEFSLKFEFIEEFDKHETNNEMKEAKKIKLNEEYNSAVFPKGDEDWFKFKTDTQGYVHLAYKDKPENLNLSSTFAVRDEFSGEEMKLIKGIEELPLSIALIEAGEYYFMLNDRWNEVASESLITWKIDFIPEMDTNEPNDEYINAKPLDIGDTAKIAIFPKNDKDLFKIKAQNKGILKIKSSKIEGVNVSAGVFKLLEDENKLKEVGKVNELPYEFEIEETNVDYYIKVFDRWKENESKEIFDIVFELEK